MAFHRTNANFVSGLLNYHSVNPHWNTHARAHTHIHTHTRTNVCKRTIFHCHYVSSGYHSNTLHEPWLCSTSQTSEQSFISVYRVDSVSIGTTLFLCGYVKCSILYKENCLWLTIHACYSWEMALNVASTHHSITCRIRKEYGIKQGKLTVRKFI
jgi:hypothetical protein